MVPASGGSMPASSRSSVDLPEPFGPRSPAMVPRSMPNDTLSSTSAAARPRVYENDRLCAVSIGDRDIERPAAGPLDVPAVSEMERPVEQWRVRDDRVVLAALAAGIDPEPREFRQAVCTETPAEPRVIQYRRARRHDQGVRARQDPLVKQGVGRQSPQRLDGDEPAGLAHPFGPATVFLEQNVAEHDVRGAGGGDLLERRRERIVVGRP